MTVDLGLALRAGLDAFARPIVVTPLKSQPGQPAYAARGVWASKPVDVALEGGGILSSQDHTIGLRLAEFSTPIASGDRIDIAAFLTMPALGIFLVEDIDEDGQGGASLSLKVKGS